MQVRTVMFVIIAAVCTMYAADSRSETISTVVNEQLTAQDKSCYVRVLLDKREVHESIAWECVCKKGIIVHVGGASSGCPSSGCSAGKKIKASRVTVRYHAQNFLVNGKSVGKGPLYLHPEHDEEGILFDGNIYKGKFIVALLDERLVLINVVELEEYVSSVVRWESWPGWPLEVNKVFSIMARTYVVDKMLKSRKKKKKEQAIWYDIGCTNKHQTYKGSHNYDGVMQAVQETKGFIAAYKKKPINAMYDCCCGGIIPAHIEGINFEDMPYLARTYPCTYCNDCKLYTWKRSYSLADFEKMVQKELAHITSVQDISLVKVDRAGKVHEARIIARNTCSSITGDMLYRVCKDIKSFCYTVQKSGSQIIFSGKGYGHHLGMCQWGARRMVKEGWDHRGILRFYYPGISFMKIEII